ncbi:hypothetical protein NG799_13535 [Laspinema sp. D1]|uniref:Uncharacterized protein n=1 Tax=Laspinema palackyanum D2a TaxID=2953684 RepID=A0ABT2MRM0_9CYAN|nr:hypothetical protein [Laspinema sp. D2a]
MTTNQRKMILWKKVRLTSADNDSPDRGSFVLGVRNPIKLDLDDVAFQPHPFGQIPKQGEDLGKVWVLPNRVPAFLHNLGFRF